MDKKYIVLDIDRTILKGTSWYYACAFPNLLIEEEKCCQFKYLNEKYFISKDERKMDYFRQETLKLIENIVSKEFLQLLESKNINHNLIKDSYTSEERFYLAGMYTVKCLVEIDEYWYETMKMFLRYYSNNITVLFLTAGYKPFMEGVVSQINKKFDNKMKYEIIGSELLFAKGVATNNKIISQVEKYEIIKKIICNSDKIVFLADDSTEEPKLFEVVEQNDGIAFKVEYDYKTHTTNWEQLYRKIIHYRTIENYLTVKSEVKLKSNEYLQKIRKFFIENCNEIGIISLSVDEYANIDRELNDSSDGKKIFSLFREFIYESGDRVYLRGLLYYFWLPPYLNPTIRSLYENWRLLLCNSIEFLDRLSRYNAKKVLLWEILVFVAVDHLISALYHSVNYLEKQSIEKGIIRNKTYYKLTDSIELLNDLMLSIILGENIHRQIEKAIKKLQGLHYEEFHGINDLKAFLMELDNQIVIFESALSVYYEIKEKKINYDYIISFAYGGMALGYALHAVVKKFEDNTIPILTCHYSSKDRQEKQNKSILNNIPKYFDVEKKNLLNGSKKILLYDNNVTTFKTLKNAKGLFSDLGNDVSCAVAEINYDNICKWFLKEGQYEELVDNWCEVLTFSPVEKYVTAFNTWGTSLKSALLEHLYGMSKINEIKLKNIINNKMEMRKICRVHNIFDLNLAIIAGATMVGIHAVYGNKKKYYEDENIMKGMLVKKSSLPIPDYELEGIRRMVKYMPSEIVPIVVIEEQIEIDSLEKILFEFDLTHSMCGVQIQFRTNDIYIDKLINYGFICVIITVGINQQDIYDYFWKVHSSLRADKDYILIDMSKHQPDLIVDKHKMLLYQKKMNFKLKFKLIEKLLGKIRGNIVPILLADDLLPEEMIILKLMMKSNGVNIVGLDMQNSVEVEKSKQGYMKVQTLEKGFYYVKLRKSIVEILKWSAYSMD